MWWVFLLALDANSAQTVARQSMPADTTYDGRVAPIQYTVRWDNVVQLTNGLYAFHQKPGLAIPGTVSQTLTDAQIASLLPLLPQ